MDIENLDVLDIILYDNSMGVFVYTRAMGSLYMVDRGVVIKDIF